MSGFEQELRRVAAAIELPHPARSRVLLELASDLEDMRVALLSEGLSEEEAHRRALEVLLPAPEAIADLRAVHRPLYQRLVDRFSERTRHRMERMLLAAVTMVLVMWSAVVVTQPGLRRSPSVFVWPLLGLAAAVAVVGLGKLFQLYVSRDHAPARLRRGMSLLPALAVASTAVGFTGAVLDLYAVTSAIEADVAHQGMLVLEWVRSDTVMLALALLVTVAAALLWFLAAVRIARIEQAEAEALGLSRPPAPGPTT